MKKILILLAILMIGISANAQNRWKITASTSMAVLSKEQSGWGEGLTIGRYINKNNDMRIELHAGRYFANKGKDWSLVSALATLEAQLSLFRSEKLYLVSSLGAGLLFAEDSRGERVRDMVLPMRAILEYRFTRHFSLGLDVLPVLNLSKWKERSLAHYGIVVGFRF